MIANGNLRIVGMGKFSTQIGKEEAESPKLICSAASRCAARPATLRAFTALAANRNGCHGAIIAEGHRR